MKNILPLLCVLVLAIACNQQTEDYSKISVSNKYSDAIIPLMNKSRYRRITIFFAKIILNIVFWELLLARIGFRPLVNKSRNRRLKNIAQNFRHLAVDMGGVMIKVGQFLSSRMDVLPEVITNELAGLQDEVAPESYEDIVALAEAEFNAPLDKIFAEFDMEPLAAASLGQVHKAKLFPPKEGEVGESFGVDIVVKVQRPNIEEIITIDLAALRKVGDWVMRYKPIRKRVDLPAILVEFSRITFEEIDPDAGLEQKNYLYEILIMLSEQLAFLNLADPAGFIEQHIDQITTFPALSRLITRLIRDRLPKKSVVLLIDEVDKNSDNPLFLTFLLCLASNSM